MSPEVTRRLSSERSSGKCATEPLVVVLAVISLVMISAMRVVEGWFGHDDRKLDED